ncbi:MAG TPA: hypothetical protein VGR30_15140 [Candidatus Binatia bacterium]|nr:hypothetical protein [Candidatus Binatia bacterium]
MFFVFLLGSVVGCATIKPSDSNYFAIHSESAALNPKQVEQIARRLDQAAEDVSKFLGFSYDFERKGKIYVEIKPGVGVSHTTPDLGIVFYASAAAQGRVLVHEVTHIVTGRHEDFFIRHLDAPYMEEKFGSILSFPTCGYSLDLWAAAYLSTNRLVPLDQMSPNSSDWGYALDRARKVTYVANPHRQHLSYTVAGSFGKYLIERYGAGMFKEFHARGFRAWNEVYKKPLKSLEGEWRDNLRALLERETNTVKSLVSFLSTPGPCLAALQSRR